MLRGNGAVILFLAISYHIIQNILKIGFSDFKHFNILSFNILFLSKNKSGDYFNLVYGARIGIG